MFHVIRKGSAGLSGHRIQCLGCHWKQAWTILRLRSSVTSAASEVVDDAKPFSDIPGPSGLPYFGTYFRHKLGGINVYKMPETLKEWYRQYGGVVKETLLGHTVVHVFDPEAIVTAMQLKGSDPLSVTNFL
ncbi:hypothetical protein V1264_020972 [Littorina saxatilis]|uniref:Uncharacterized protein n=1 Tax=Littorina saxatilis TaxID=31220 RepID=A0AAN9GC24_9CAEN